MAHRDLPQFLNRLATKQTTFRTSSDPSDILPLVTLLGPYYIAKVKRYAG